MEAATIKDEQVSSSQGVGHLANQACSTNHHAFSLLRLVMPHSTLPLEFGSVSSTGCTGSI
eukprot:2216026-Amphidinium_carterae.1